MPGVGHNEPHHCCLCGEPLAAGSWVLLNRYAVGGQSAVRMIQGEDRRTGYRWDPDAIKGSGAMLCLRPCAVIWLEGKMIETDFIWTRENG